MSGGDLPTSVKFGTAGLGGILGWVIVHPFNTFAVRMSLASSQPGYVPCTGPAELTEFGPRVRGSEIGKPVVDEPCPRESAEFATRPVSRGP